MSGGEITCNNGVLRKSKNLLPLPSLENGWVNGYLKDSDGNIADASAYKEMTSPFIPVAGNENYTLSFEYKTDPISYPWVGLLFYDETKTPTGYRSSTSVDRYSRLSPADAAYARVSVRTYDIIDWLQFELGSSPTLYTPYDSVVVDGTPEMLTVSPSGDTANAENLYAVGSIRDEQDIVSGRITRRTAATIYHDGDDVGDDYIGELVDGNPIVYALSQKYSGEVATFEADREIPMRDVNCLMKWL